MDYYTTFNRSFNVALCTRVYVDVLVHVQQWKVKTINIMAYDREMIEFEDKIYFSGKCTVTNKEYCVVCYAKDYYRCVSGELIQRTMPYLTDSQREFIISGTTPDEWKKLFPPEEED